MIVNERSSAIHQIITLRYIVGFLGEKSQFGWWPTAFYEASSRQFLEPVFSKTAPLAQYHGIVEAGRRIHDEHLNVGSYHLFRLSEEIEQNLHEMVQTKLDELFDSELTSNLEAALGALGEPVLGVDQAAEGPILVGKIKDFQSTAMLDRMTDVYRTAFLSRTQAFPYMVK
jgi:hypothetical protein